MKKLFSVSGRNPSLGFASGSTTYHYVVAETHNEAVSKFIDANPLFIADTSVTELSKVIW